MTIEQLATRLRETALAWQLGVDDHRRGRISDEELNMLAVAHYRAIKAYRAATR